MSRSPFSVKATTDGVRRLPCELINTLGWSPSMMATTLLVVPRSIPIIFAIFLLLLRRLAGAVHPAILRACYGKDCAILLLSVSLGKTTTYRSFSKGLTGPCRCHFDSRPTRAATSRTHFLRLELHLPSIVSLANCCTKL